MNWYVFGWTIFGIGLLMFGIVFVLQTIIKIGKLKNWNWKILIKKRFWNMLYFLSLTIMVTGIIINYGGITLWS